MDEKAHLPILKRVGIFLIVVGSIDLAAFLYTLQNNITYSSNFNIFGIAAGYFLLRGNLLTVVLVQWFSAFVLASTLTLVAGLSVLQPIDLTIAYIRFESEKALIISGFFIFFFISFSWIYMQLSSASVQEARAAAGKKKRNMIIPVCLGVISISFLFFLAHYVLKNNPDIDRAKLLATQQLQGNYQVHVLSLDIKKNNDKTDLITAQVVAWNENDLKRISVKWEQEKKRR